MGRLRSARRCGHGTMEANLLVVLTSEQLTTPIDNAGSSASEPGCTRS